MNCNMEINTEKSLLLYYQCTVLFPIHSQFSHMQKGSKNYHLKKAHTSQHKQSKATCKTPNPCSAQHAKRKRNIVGNLNAIPTHTALHPTIVSSLTLHQEMYICRPRGEHCMLISISQYFLLNNLFMNAVSDMELISGGLAYIIMLSLRGYLGVDMVLVCSLVKPYYSSDQRNICYILQFTL